MCISILIWLLGLTGVLLFFAGCLGRPTPVQRTAAEIPPLSDRLCRRLSNSRRRQ